MLSASKESLHERLLARVASMTEWLADIEQEASSSGQPLAELGKLAEQHAIVRRAKATAERRLHELDHGKPERPAQIDSPVAALSEGEWSKLLGDVKSAVEQACVSVGRKPPHFIAVAADAQGVVVAFNDPNAIGIFPDVKAAVASIVTA